MAYPPPKKVKKRKGANQDRDDNGADKSTENETISISSSSSNSSAALKPPVITPKGNVDRKDLNFTSGLWGKWTEEKYKLLLTKFHDKRIKSICKQAKAFMKVSMVVAKTTAASSSKISIIDLTADNEQHPDFNIAINFDDDASSNDTDSD